MTPDFEQTPGEALKRNRRTWACKGCAWSGTSPPHVVIFFHRCRPDGVRRQLVELPDEEGHAERMQKDRLDWYLKTYPGPHLPGDTP
ncbi:MAG: hypothetical protein IH943_06185 [Acidobacteria bacterium]|nr:hypothetical protein [Acidobacteriota bacterium]